MEHVEPKPILVEEREMGNLKLWVTPGIEKPRNLDPGEKIRLDKHTKTLAEKAQNRSESCWSADCTGTPRYWVREVQFDFKGDKAEAGTFAHVSSDDYTGPVPGFCIGCIGSGPAKLAQAVYFSREEMQWGLRPRRWFCIFTDDTKQGGDCMELDPLQLSPNIQEEWNTWQQ